MPVTEDDLAEIKDRIYAVQNLLLCHIAAAETEHALGTIDQAKAQHESMVKNRRFRAAIHLDAMIDNLRKSLDLPVNDR